MTKKNRVQDVMNKNVQFERTESSISVVIAKMNKFDIGSLIIAKEKRPIGIITERDILRSIMLVGTEAKIGHVHARDIMSSPVTTINEDDSIDEAANLMAQKRIKKLPVVRDNSLVGIITIIDVVKPQRSRARSELFSE